MKITAIAAATIIVATSAYADSYWHCKGDNCVGVEETPTAPAPLGTYNNPIMDQYSPNYANPRPGMYCVRGSWHSGWLRPGQSDPYIGSTCGSAVYQIPHD